MQEKNKALGKVIDVFNSQGILFHTTLVENLPSILQNGILSRNMMIKMGISIPRSHYGPLLQEIIGWNWISLTDPHVAQATRCEHYGGDDEDKKFGPFANPISCQHQSINLIVSSRAKRWKPNMLYRGEGEVPHAYFGERLVKDKVEVANIIGLMEGDKEITKEAIVHCVSNKVAIPCYSRHGDLVWPIKKSYEELIRGVCDENCRC